MAAKRGRIGKNRPILKQENIILADKWLAILSDSYEEYRHKFNNYNFSEDVINNTVILCYESISRNGLADTSKQGCLNYFFRAYNQNVKSNNLNPYDKRKTEVEDFNQLNEDDEQSKITIEEKIKKDLFSDFAVSYLITIVENQFDTISAYCWRIKSFVPKMTYQKLREITKIKNCKQRVISVNNWLKENINKNELIKEFNKTLE